MTPRQGGRPAPDRATHHARAGGHTTIGLPCSQEPYEPFVADPQPFRQFLDQQIAVHPELVPPEIRRGDRLKDTATSRKTGGRLRRIDLRNGRCSLDRPSFLMPDRAGRAVDVRAPRFSARAPSPIGR